MWESGEKKDKKDKKDKDKDKDKYKDKDHKDKDKKYLSPPLACHNTLNLFTFLLAIFL